MGDLVSTLKTDAKDAVSSAVIRSKLVDLRIARSKRNRELAFRMATTRERCHWLLCFYATLITVNWARLRIAGQTGIRNWTPLQLAYLPFVGTPFVFAYQLDFGYSNKLSRLNNEAEKILRCEKHWFNKSPLRLPKAFEQEYLAMRAEAAAKRGGKLDDVDADDHWAVFENQLSGEELRVLQLPATKFIEEQTISSQPDGVVSSFTTTLFPWVVIPQVPVVAGAK